MASAEQFLQLLEEKDLVSPQVLQAARREIGRTSPPPDAVGMSLWLVQGQHITASQAERLLSAVMEKASDPAADTLRRRPVPQPSISRWQKGEPKPTEALRQPIPPPPSPPKVGQRAHESRAATRSGDPRPDRPQSPTPNSMDDLELAPEPGPTGGQAAQTPPLAGAPKKPAKPTRPAAKAQGTATVSPATPSAGAPAQQGPKTSGASTPAAVGGPLEPLEKTMRGPLDSLIESEARDSSPFEDSMDGPTLNPTGPKKFKLRHLMRRFFRRHKSKTVTVKAADPRQVKLLLFTWGLAIFIILGALAIFRYLSPDSTEILRTAEVAADRGDYAEAINQYDKFLKANPKTTEADEVRMLRVLAESASGRQASRRVR